MPMALRLNRALVWAIGLSASGDPTRAPPSSRTSSITNGHPRPAPATSDQIVDGGRCEVGQQLRRVRQPSGSTGSMLIRPAGRPAGSRTCRRSPDRGRPGPGRRARAGSGRRTAAAEGDQDPAAQRLRHAGRRREGPEADGRGHLVGQPSATTRRRTRGVPAAVERVVEVAGVHGGDRVQRELQLGDDAEIAGAARHPQNRSGCRCDHPADRSPSASTTSARDDRVGGQTVAAAEPAEAAAEGEADHADVRTRARQPGQPVRRCRVDHVGPDRAGADPGAVGRVDSDRPELGGVDEQRRQTRPVP